MLVFLKHMFCFAHHIAKKSKTELWIMVTFSYSVFVDTNLGIDKIQHFIFTLSSFSIVTKSVLCNYPVKSRGQQWNTKTKRNYKTSYILYSKQHTKTFKSKMYLSQSKENIKTWFFIFKKSAIFLSGTLKIQ